LKTHFRRSTFVLLSRAVGRGKIRLARHPGGRGPAPSARVFSLGQAGENSFAESPGPHQRQKVASSGANPEAGAAQGGGTVSKNPTRGASQLHRPNGRWHRGRPGPPAPDGGARDGPPGRRAGGRPFFQRTSTAAFDSQVRSQLVRVVERAFQNTLAGRRGRRRETGINIAGKPARGRSGCTEKVEKRGYALKNRSGQGDSLFGRGRGQVYPRVIPRNTRKKQFCQVLAGSHACFEGRGGPGRSAVVGGGGLTSVGKTLRGVLAAHPGQFASTGCFGWDV